MRLSATGTIILGAALIAAAVAPVQIAAAEQPYCPNSAHTSPTEVPPGLIGDFARTFKIAESSVRGRAAFVRCVGHN